MDTWKLQKLLYYCQVWHLVWEGKPLFSERIEAWSNGPVVRDIYDAHRGVFSVERWPQG
ncbi:MAG: Panacea domain-containing protein, partial [Gaiellaceae bacterium]